MKPLFKPEWTKNLLRLLGLFLVVKMLWVLVELIWLPTIDIDEAKKQGSTALYYRVKLTPNESSAPKKETNRRVNGGSIKEISLLAIYHASDNTVVTIEYKRKTSVLETGEEINGFKLEGASNDFALFSKDGKSYQVDLLTKAIPGSASSSIRSSRQIKEKKAPSKPVGEVRDAGEYKVIDRSLFDHYAENMDDIYKNIGITEVKNGKNIGGFKVTFVRRNSPFAKLGIQRNDVIKSINGQAITSYAEALAVYKTIQDAVNLTVVVIRGKEEMELEYEIN